MNKNQKKLSIVVPCYNEESNLTLTYNEIIRSLKKTKINRYEIIFVDDSSIDRTQYLIKKILKKNKNTKIIINKKNLGLGATVLKGYKSCKSNYCTYVPGDNSHPSRGLIMIYKKIDFKKKIMIIPFVSDTKSRNSFRVVLSNLYTLIINFTFNLNIPYFNSLCVYPTKEVIKLKLISKGFSFQSEIIIRLVKKKMKYKLVKTILKENKQFFTSALKLSSLKSVFSSIIKLRVKI
jgi:glycosyltransferase involved in cell wall biosynthesis